ncbi:hypothetical protein TsFJ059_004908 [Trichoderma semiorbis]|uniref:Uncharacterized protein n=1 Tax=Trichoderma semiorbis TaxID=1491008 RepID=A0A9P8HPN0_9HYPO|nr:hypothetical protein TsFJ059_004908 [Trichoderma semiorbis]
MGDSVLDWPVHENITSDIDIDIDITSTLHYTPRTTHAEEPSQDNDRGLCIIASGVPNLECERKYPPYMSGSRFTTSTTSHESPQR